MNRTVSKIAVEASLEWEQESSSRVVATLSVDGAIVLLKIILEYVDEAMVAEHAEEGYELQPGWFYTDEENYYQELAVEGSELEKFISTEINRKLQELS